VKLLFIILNAEDCLEDMLSLFLELGVPGATLVDSVGMGHIIAHDIPIFAGLRGMLAGNHPYNRTIYTVLDDELCLIVMDELSAMMKAADQPNAGIMFSLPIDQFRSFS